MFIKWLILIITVWAHIWLFGQWSLNKSMGHSLALLFTGFLLAFVLLFPLKVLIQKGSIAHLLKASWFQIVVGLYVVAVFVLSAISFSGLLVYLLPIQVVLLAIKAFITFKLKKKGSSPSQDLKA